MIVYQIVQIHVGYAISTHHNEIFLIYKRILLSYSRILSERPHSNGSPQLALPLLFALCILCLRIFLCYSSNQLLSAPLFFYLNLLIFSFEFLFLTRTNSWFFLYYISNKVNDHFLIQSQYHLKWMQSLLLQIFFYNYKWLNLLIN